MSDGFYVYKRRLTPRNQRWRWRLVVNGRKVANGGEGYSDRDACEQIGRAVVSGAYAKTPSFKVVLPDGVDAPPLP